MNQEYIVRKLFDVRIYALADFSGNVFYIGATTVKLWQRKFQHVQTSKPFTQFSRSPRAKKIRELDYKIKIIELDVAGCFGVDRREAQINAQGIEMKWIKRFLDEGVELVNKRIA